MEIVPWKERVLRPRLDKLYKLRKNAVGEDLVNIDMSIEIILSELETERRAFKTANEFAYEIFKIRKMKPFMKIIRDFFVDYEYSPRIEKCPILGQKGESELIEEFFSRAVDSELFKIFMDIFRHRQINIHDDVYNEKSGQTIYLPYFDEVHIGIMRHHTIEDLVTLGHEFGHAIEFKTNYRDNMFYDNEMFLEVVSTFFELLILDFLKSKEMFSLAAMEFQQRTYFYEIYYSNAILIENYLFKRWFKDKRMGDQAFSKMVKRDLKSFRDGLFDADEEPTEENLLSKEYHFNARYIVSESLSIDLFILYLHDRDKALEKLHEYLSLDTGMPSALFMEELESRGFTFNKHKEEYADYLNDSKKFIFKKRM